MSPQAEQAEYLRAVRDRICARCPERPPDGGSCLARGRMCGVELYLRRLTDAVHETQARRTGDYGENVLGRVCLPCVARGHRGCPCPMEGLVPDAVRAVEEADQWDNPYEGVGDGCYCRAAYLAVRVTAGVCPRDWPPELD
jgi:hypothetical protein